MIPSKPKESAPNSRLYIHRAVNSSFFCLVCRVVILVCVYRYVVGVSVVQDYDKEGKRFNLRVLAETQEKQAISATAQGNLEEN